MGMMDIRRSLLQNQSDIPPIYKPCDYLQTTGYNSRIDTGVPGNDNTLEIDLDYATITRRAYAAAFGNYDGENKRCWRLINTSGTGDTRYYSIAAGNRRAGSSASILAVPEGESVIGTRINFHVSFGRCTAKYGDYSATVTPVADENDVSTRNIAIGASQPNQTGGSLVGRYWHFYIWSHGILIRSYFPYIRETDGKPGFYDTVNHTFNPSIGSVDFIAGYDE